MNNKIILSLLFTFLLLVINSSAQVTVSGNIYNDLDGRTNVNGAGINTVNSLPLYAILVNSSGMVAQNVSVSIGGAFSFSAVASGSYTVKIGTTAGTVSAEAPPGALPSMWRFISEDCCDNTANDGVSNGVVAISVASTAITNVNFGIAIDTDNDGIANATDTDNDNDGIANTADIDDDNDGVLDVMEWTICSNANANSSTATGTGAYKNNLYWFNWNAAAFSDGIQNGDSQSFTLSDGTVVTATFSNVVNITNTGGAAYRAIDMNTWSGSYVHQLYNSSGANEALYSGTDTDVSFDLTFSATKAGSNVKLNLVFADAESTANGSESIAATTNGGIWKVLESIGNGGTITGIGSTSISYTNTEGGNRILYSEDATRLSVNINAGGSEGVAFGFIAYCDSDSDGLTNAEDLDSDNDGCSDAYEAGATTINTPNFQFTGTMGANGLDNSKETAADNGTINYTSTYSANATNSSVKACCPTSAGITTTESSCTANDGKILSGSTVTLTGTGGTGYVWNQSGLRYDYYSGAYSVLPDFNALTPSVTGTISTFDIGIPSRPSSDNFAMRYRGYINILAAGTYTFYTNSDDGSKLYINGNQIVNNDGLHAPQEVSGTVTLSAGWHSIEVTFFEQGGGETLIVSYEGPGLTKQVIPASVLAPNFNPLVVTPTTSSTYSVTVINGSGCTATASSTVTVVTAPTANIAVAESFCVANDSKITSGQSATLTASGGGTYSWSNSSTTAAITVSPTTTTTYTVTVANNGCTATTSTTIQVIVGDNDCDGISDDTDIDDDNDGVTDCTERGFNDTKTISDYFQLNGNAAKLSNTEVRLTSASTAQAGQMWGFNKVDFERNFTLSFQAYIGNNDAGGDGMAAVFHNSPSGLSAVGGSGGGLGALGIANGIVLEFDTYDNGTGAGDLAADHGSIWDSDNGSAYLSSAVALPNLEDNAWHNIVITWNATTQKLSYTVDGTTAGQYTGNVVANYFGGVSQVYFGYTASTGGAVNEQKVKYTSFCTDLPFVLDSDNDGTPNYLELDSDGDGCSDSYEAGATTSTTANYQFTGAVGTNGLIDSKETVADNGTINYTSIYPNYAISSTYALCRDTDNDGIIDMTDIDDDNDGVPDMTDCETHTFYWSSAPVVSGTTATGTINGVAYTYTSSQNVGTTTNMYSVGTFPASYNVPNLNPTIMNTVVTNNTITFASPVANPILAFSSIGNPGTPVPIIFGQPVQILWSTAVVQNSSTQVTGNEGFAIIKIPGVFTSISFQYTAAETYVNLAFGAETITTRDTDNDGVIDCLDLDSDNDGCSDAYEAGATTDKTANYKFTGAVGTNGLINTKETVADNGTINYISTFSTYAQNNYLNICTDTDNDNVADVFDIDDDNDAILDITECPNTNLVANSSFTTDLSNWTSSGGWVVSGGSVANTAENVTNQTLSQTINFSSAKVNNSSIVVSFLVRANNVNNSLSGTPQTANLKVLIGSTQYLDIANGSTMTASVTPSNGASCDITGLAITTTTGVFTPLNLTIPSSSLPSSGSLTFSFSATSDDFTMDDVVVLQKCIDTDGDGTANITDLDSDGDGCSDAYESGATTSKTANYKFTGTMGTNGLDNSKETVADNGVINYTSTYSTYGLNNYLNVCTDTDNDNVADILDIDDDNDGVLDVTENICTTAIVPTGATSNHNYSTSYATYTIDGSGLTGSGLNATHIENWSLTQGWLGADTYGTVVLNYPFAAGTNLSGVALWTPANTNWGVGDAPMKDFQITVTYNGGTKWTSPLWTTSSTSKTSAQIFSFDTTLTNVTNVRLEVFTGWWYSYPTYSTAPTGYSSSYNMTLAEFRGVGACSFDTDGDGIVNRLDLDSDGDGCSDAYESGATTSKTANYQFTGAVGTNGLDNTKETATDNGTINYTSKYTDYALANTLNFCTDTDNDGISNVLDIDDDNDGVLDNTEGCASTVTMGTVNSTLTTQLSTNNTVVFPLVPAGTTLPNGGVRVTKVSGTSNGWGVYTPPITTTTLTMNGFTSASFPTTYIDMTGTVARNLTIDFGTSANAISTVNNQYQYVIGIAGLGSEGANLSTTFSTTLTVLSNSNVFSTGLYSLLNGVASTTAGLTGTIISTNTPLTTAQGYTFYSIPKSVASFTMDLSGGNDPHGFIIGVYNANCTQDTDSDGIVNSLDLDSDGDGCSDAYESAATTSITANYQFIGTVGTNGLDNSKEAVADNGIINYTSTYATNATNNAIKACCPAVTITSTESSCTANDDKIKTGQSATLTANGGTGYLWSTSATSAAIVVTPSLSTTYRVTVSNASGCTITATKTISLDNDCDLVADELDIDDDNDGVLDLTECNTTISPSSVTSTNSLQAPQSQLNRTIDGGIGTDISTYFANTGTEVIDKVTYSFGTALNGYNKILLYNNGGALINDGQSITSIDTINVYNTLGAVIYSTTAYAAAGSIPEGSLGYPFQIDIGMVTGASYIDLINIKGTIGGTAGICWTEFSISQCADTDGDGIANLIDLDSDGDGCSDAYEGGATTNLSPNYAFTGTVGTNGLDNTKETADNGTINYTSTYTTNALSNTVKTCCPTVTAPTNQIVCAGGMVSAVSFSGNMASGVTYNWVNNNTTIGLGASGTGNISSFTAINSGTTPVIGTLTVTPSTASCTGTAQNFNITAYNDPVAPAIIKR